MKRSRSFVLFLVLTLLLATTTAVSAAPYTVRPGDTLSGIAALFGVSMQSIIDANNIENPRLIIAGQVLEIPGVDRIPENLPPPAARPAPVAPAASVSPTGTVTYVVQRGDSLSRIAASFGANMYAIAAANNIQNLNLISVGQTLVIPGATGVPAAAAPAAPAASAPAAPVAPPIFSGGFELGGQTQSFANRQLMREVGMTWVKFQHKWSPGDSPDAVAGRIADAHASGFKVLLSMPGANTYPPPGGIDFGGYVEFLRGVAALGPDAIEVWNEMNIDFEWPAGEISPTSYVNNMLAPAYNAIKSVNPNILVIAGALAPTGFDNGFNAWADDRYVRGMAAAGAARYMDCIGVHHNAGATSPSATSGHPGGSHYSWYFRPTLDVYYNAFGGARKVCFTELGYVSPQGFPGISSNFGWAANTSVEQHAQWLAEAVRLSAASGKVRMLIIFNVDFTYYDVSGDPQAGYAMVRPDGSCPVCNFLRR